ncbi:MAG: hypothetical protein ACKO2L_09235 [Planctomycetaceae bacterium]
MSTNMKRVNCFSEEKVAILRAHFVDGAAQLCDRKPNATNVRRQEAAMKKKVEALVATCCVKPMCCVHAAKSHA